MVVFWLGLTTFVTEVLVRRLELRWFDDVCNVGRPLVARPGPVVAHQHCGQAFGPSGALYTGGACAEGCGLARRLEARPGPAFTPRASCQALASINAEPAPNFARNSPATLSNSEFRSLELQRFRTLLKLRPIELRATFLGVLPHCPRNFACNSFASVSWFEV